MVRHIAAARSRIPVLTVFNCTLLCPVAALNPGDIDAELERLEFVHRMPAIVENPGMADSDGRPQQGSAPRPLSPTRLQPVVAPEAQDKVITEELLLIRSQIPRALKRRGSIDHSQPLKHASHYQPNQYKTLIDKLFRQKERGHKGEQGSDQSSSSDGEDAAMPPALPPQPSSSFPHDLKVRVDLRATDHTTLPNQKLKRVTGRDFLGSDRSKRVYFCQSRVTIQFCGARRNARAQAGELGLARWSWRWMGRWWASWRRCRELFRR